MNETQAVIVFGPLCVGIITFLLIIGRKLDRFVADVKSYIQDKHPEVSIMKQVGFGFDMQIKDRVYRIWLKSAYARYRKAPSKFEDVMEHLILRIPFEERSLPIEKYKKPG